MNEVISRIARYLKLLNKKFEIISDNEIIVHEKIDDREEEIHIRYEHPWIDTYWVGPSILEFREDPERYRIMLELTLRLDSALREAKISLGDDDHIYVAIHSRVDALTFDVYESEYNSIPYAIKAVYEQIEAVKNYRVD